MLRTPEKYSAAAARLFDCTGSPFGLRHSHNTRMLSPSLNGSGKIAAGFSMTYTDVNKQT